MLDTEANSPLQQPPAPTPSEHAASAGSIPPVVPSAQVMETARLETARFPFDLPGAPVTGAWNEASQPFTFLAPEPNGAPSTLRLRSPRRHHWARILVAFALLLTLTLGTGLGAILVSARSAATGAPAGTASSSSVTASTLSLQQSVESVLQAVSPSVVEVISAASGQEAIGSGDIVTTSGYIVTNDHVVQGYTSFHVTLSNGTSLAAQLVGQDAQDDLALLKISASHLTPITLADSSKAQTGEFVLAVGDPLGLQQSATLGIISALNRSASEAPDGPAGELTDLIQTSAQLNPGNSGGALLDLQGQLIGIPTLGAINAETGSAADGIGYAIPANRVTYVVNQLIHYGKLANSGQGFLGIQGEDVTSQLAAIDRLATQSGVLVTGFTGDTSGQSPAQRAGIQSGDVITLAPSTRVTVTLLRGPSTRTITVTLGERPLA
jgi:S1-C subfamily serine protease